MSLAEEVNKQEGIDKLFIVNLGDELDGFNKQTTRGGHEVDSLSNREQFNIYTTARKLFYDTVIENFAEVEIININNSNHSGNDYSYIVNKALEFYLDARYSNVFFKNQDKFIDTYNWGNHTIALTHGKDEKYMKSAMPLNLDHKTDLWLTDFYTHSKSTGKFFSCIKGDLHNYSVNVGKSGRYVNVPSICGGSNWIEHNFGSSNAGALLEIVEKNDKNITSKPIWF